MLPILGGKYFSDPHNRHFLCCLKSTRGLMVSGRNFKCNMGATQPRGIFLPPPLHKSTQLYEVNFRPPFWKSIQMYSFQYVHHFCCSSDNEFSRFPFLFPPSDAHYYSSPLPACPRCVAFHMYSSSMHSAISSTLTNDSFFQYFLITNRIHHYFIYIWTATFYTSNCLNFCNFSSCAVLEMLLSALPGMSSF
jgi:hypothetical protein